jgi:hypothetical protein
MDITFTLQAGFSGTQADNFNISGTTSSGTLMSLGSATKAQLTTGHTVNADPTITGGTITSTGVCTTSVDWLTFGNQVPETSILTYYFAAGFYYFSLSEALQDSITILNAYVDGHTTAGCGMAAEDQASIQSPVTITAGVFNVDHDAEVVGWESINYINPANQITLLDHGTILNGGTFTVPSGTIVTVTYDDSCQIYPQ